jgi:hypothetical protein
MDRRRNAMNEEPVKYLAVVTIEMVAYGYDEHDASDKVQRILDGVGAWYDQTEGIKIYPTE